MDERRVRRAVVITDGYVGRPTGGVREVLLRTRLGVALTPAASSRSDLEEVADFWCELSP
jgi:hypothetical protein